MSLTLSEAGRKRLLSTSHMNLRQSKRRKSDEEMEVETGSIDIDLLGKLLLYDS